jgi:hypothetical protein
MERTETDHPIVGRKRAIAETVSSLVEHILLQRRRGRRDTFHVFICAVNMTFHIVSPGKSHLTLWTCRRNLVKHVFPL